MSAFVAAAVTAAAATAYSAYQGHEARKDQRRANEKAARAEAVRGQAERAQALRQNRLAASTIFAMGANAGVQGSSGVQGSLAALGTNQGINFQLANSLDALNAERLRALGRAEGHEGQAAIAGAVGQIAGIRVGMGRGG